MPERAGPDASVPRSKAARLRRIAACWYHPRPFPLRFSTDMMELNPIRQRIAELSERLDALRGFL